MKPKPQYRTRDEGGEITPAVDSRFSLFYTNAHNGKTGLYNVIGDTSKNSWDYEADKNKTDIQHLPAENTVFINANVALTDASCKKFNTTDKTPRTIPNLYDALSALAAKISELDNRIKQGFSSADKYLYVTKSDDNKLVTLYPGKFEETTNNTVKDETVEKIQITSSNGPTSIVISNNDIQFTIKPNSDADSRTYNLGAIIEAIQELNRRTAYIDSTMKFTDAKDHFDVNEIESGVTGAEYETKDDGLPAATDGHYSGNLGPGTRSVLSDKLEKMKLIAYDPETNKTIEVTGKNLPFTRELSKLNNIALLDDPTVISPESVAIRMRGCPYLLQ